MHIIHRQYILTIYTDGSFKLTERKPTAHGVTGRFTGACRRVLGRTTCPACGARLATVAEEVA